MKNPVRLFTLAVLCSLAFALHATQAQRNPWKRRLRTGVVLTDAPEARREQPRGSLDSHDLRRLGLRPRGDGLVDLSHWPQEPPSPATVTPAQLTAALVELCPATTHASLGSHASAIVRYSREFSVDPWLLAAVVYTQSACDPTASNSYGTGLTLINIGMHEAHVRDGSYRFGVRDKEGWRRGRLDISAFPFSHEALLDPEANLYFAAALLRVFGQQCPHIDSTFESEPHRHFVSHFVWGDHVADTRPEDRILTARRRLLRSHARTNRNNRGLEGIEFVSPLEGFPRIVTSGLGDPRDQGRRPHRGIDLASELGEPVLAVASGVVTFAGVDWERKARIALEPWGARLVHRRHMGPKGLFVEIDHGDGITTLYAHLERYDVGIGDEVLAGQLVGLVGDTGVRDSGAHLHLGLFQYGVVLDPLAHLAAFVFPPKLTRRGQASLVPSPTRRRRPARQR